MGVGSTIKKILDMNSMTVKELSTITNVSASTLYSIVNRDNATVNTAIVEKIAEALGTHPAKLMGWEPISDRDYYFLEKKLNQLGYGFGTHMDESGDPYIWINYPDGTLEVSDYQLNLLDKELTSYLKFKLNELKDTNTKDFRPRKKK